MVRNWHVEIEGYTAIGLDADGTGVDRDPETEEEPAGVDEDASDCCSDAAVSFVPWARVDLRRRSSRVVQMHTYAPIVGIAWAHF
jgi:hypothetical protein